MENKKSFLFVLTVCVVCLVLPLAGCKNFMQLAGFKDTIETEVDVANAEQVTITLNSVKGTGDTYLSGTKLSGTSVQKQNVSFNVDFEEGDGYGFSHWAAFDSTDDDYDLTTLYAPVYAEDGTTVMTSYYDSSKELGSDVVEFGTPTGTWETSDSGTKTLKSAATTVTLKTTKANIVIVPVCAVKPVLNSSNPKDGKESIVRNASIYLYFSKPMDISSFYDSDYAVTDGTISGTSLLKIQSQSGDPGDPDVSDIQKYFATPILGNKKGTTIYLKAKQVNSSWLPRGTTVVVTIPSAIADINGYSLGSSVKVSYTLGSNTDDQPPVIDTLTAGYTDLSSFSSIDASTADNYSGFTSAESYYTDTTNGGNTQLTQRVGNAVYVYVYSYDISKEGETTGSETDVSAIRWTASSILHNDGVTAGTSTETATKYVSYFAAVNDSAITDSAGVASSKGYAFTADLSSLPDGLIKIVFHAIDSYTNETTDANAKVIYVVKDTAAPDMSSEKDKIVSAGLTTDWYNINTLSSDLKLTVADGKTILDNSSEYLQPSVLYWAIKLGTDLTETIPSSSSLWKQIKISGVNQSYIITNASASSQGSLDILGWLKDDVGNSSSAAKLNAVKYDSVAPEAPASVVSSSSSDVYPQSTSSSSASQYWVKSSSGTAFTVSAVDYDKGASGSETAAETAAETTYASGIQGFTLAAGSCSTSDSDNHTTVKIGTDTVYSVDTTGSGSSSSVVLVPGTNTIYSVDNAYNVSASSKNITVVLDDTAPSISVTTNASTLYDSSKSRYEDASGNYYYNKNESGYPFTVTLTDNDGGSGNKGFYTNGDTTTEKVSGTEVVLAAGTYIFTGEDNLGNTVKSSSFTTVQDASLPESSASITGTVLSGTVSSTTATTTNDVTVTVTASDEGSGVRALTLSGDAVFTAPGTITAGSSTLTKDTDYYVASGTNTETIYLKTVQTSGTSSVIYKIGSVTLTDSDGTKTITCVASDASGNSSSAASASINKDTKAPNIDSVTVVPSDTSLSSSTTPVTKNKTISVEIAAEDITSGIKRVYVLDSSSVSSLLPSGKSLLADSSVLTVTGTTSVSSSIKTDSNGITYIELAAAHISEASQKIDITSVSLPQSAEGTQTIYVMMYDDAENGPSVSSASVIYDTTAPAFAVDTHASYVYSTESSMISSQYVTTSTSDTTDSNISGLMDGTYYYSGTAGFKFSVSGTNDTVSGVSAAAGYYGSTYMLTSSSGTSSASGYTAGSADYTLAAGTYTISAEDNIGNTRTTGTIKVAADTTVPVISGVSFYNSDCTTEYSQSATSDSTFGIKFTANDATTGIRSLAFSGTLASSGVFAAAKTYSTSNSSGYRVFVGDTEYTYSSTAGASGNTYYLTTANGVTTLYFNTPIAASSSASTIKVESLSLTNESGTKLDDGTYALVVTPGDCVSNMVSAAVVNFSYDGTAPVIGTLSFSRDSGLAAYCNAVVLSSHTLAVPFTEDVSGVKTITVKVTKDGETTELVSAPFASASVYSAWTSSTSNTAASGSASADVYTLDSYYTTGTLYIRGLTVYAADQTEDVTVTLTDRAGNVSSSAYTTITYDTKSPAMYAYNNTTYQSTFAGNQDVRYYPWTTSCSGNTLTLYVNETGSGVASIKSGTISSSGLIFTSSSAVTVYDDNGVSKGSLTNSSSADYYFSSDYSTLNFVSSTSPLVKGEHAKIVITNVTANAEHWLNTSVLTLTDFSGGSNSSSTTNTLYLGVDVECPHIFAQCSLADNNASPIAAASGYTNDTSVTLTIGSGYEYTNSSKYYISGLWYIELTTGGTFSTGSTVTFTNVYDSSIAATQANTITAGSQTWSYLGTLDSGKTPAVSRTATGFYLSSDLTKLYFASPISVHSTVLTVTKVNIGNTEGTESLTTNLVDLAGNSSSTDTDSSALASYRTASIILDTTAPWWDGASSDSKAGTGPFTACDAYRATTAYRKTDETLVYPFRSGEDGHGSTVGTTTNSDSTTVRYFYTKYTEYEGDYGAVLGIPANDNLMLRGVQTATTSFYYYKANADAATVLSSGTNPTTDRNGNTTSSSHPKDYSEWQWFPCTQTSTTSPTYVAATGTYVSGTTYYTDSTGATTVDTSTFTAGTTSVTSYYVASTTSTTTYTPETDTVYSVVITDAAGNYSPAYTFHLIYDAAGPAVTNTDSTSIMTGLVKKDATTGSGSYQVVCPNITNSLTSFGYTATNGCAKFTGDAYKNLMAYHSTEQIQVVVDLSNYAEITSTTTECPLAYYGWNGDSTNQMSSGTATDSSLADWNQWHPFTEGSTSVTVYPSASVDMGPMYLWLKDKLGNVSKIEIRTAAHETAGAHEVWERDGTAPTVTLSNYASSSADTADGTLEQSNNVNYYNNKAFLSGSVTDDHCFVKSTTATASDYSCRYILISTSSSEKLSKAAVDTAYTAAASAGNNYIGWYYCGATTTSTAMSFTPCYPRDTSTVGYYMHYVFEDAVGNYTTGTLTNGTGTTWTYDNTAPTIGISAYPAAPTGKQLYASDTSVYYPDKTTISFTGGDTYGITGYYFSSDGASAPSSWTTGSSLALLKALNLTSGSTQNSADAFKLAECSPSNWNGKTAYLWVRDIVGNTNKVQILTSSSASTSQTWTYDATSPAASGTAQSSVDTTNGYSISVSDAGVLTVFGKADSESVTVPSAAYSDAAAGLYGCSTTADSVSTVDSANPWVVSLSGSTASLYVYDHNGNCGKYAVSYTADTTAPTISASADSTNSTSGTNFTSVGGSEANIYVGGSSTSYYAALTFTLADTNGSGVNGISFSGYTTTPELVSGSATSGTAVYKFYNGSTTVTVTDNVGNTTVYTVKVAEDTISWNTDPATSSINAVPVAAQEYSASTPYYSAGSVLSGDGGTITLYTQGDSASVSLAAPSTLVTCASSIQGWSTAATYTALGTTNTVTLTSGNTTTLYIVSQTGKYVSVKLNLVKDDTAPTLASSTITANNSATVYPASVQTLDTANAITYYINSVDSASTLTTTYTATEAGSGIASVAYTVGSDSTSTGLTASDGTYTLALANSTVDATVESYKFTITDNVGLSTSYTVNLTPDVTGPTLSATAAAVGISNSGNANIPTKTYTDALGTYANSYANYYIGGWTFNSSGIPTAGNVYYIYMTSGNNSNNSTKVYFTLDGISDAGSGAATAGLNLTTAAPGTTITVSSGSAEGIYKTFKSSDTSSLALWLYDNLGNYTTIPLTMTQDTASPSIDTVSYGTSGTTTYSASDLYTAEDYEAYVTNYYKSGLTLSAATTEASGIIAYALGYDDTNSDTSATTVGDYTSMTLAASPSLSITMPDSTLASNWRHCWLYVKDAVGRVGIAKLYKPDSSSYTWWRCNTVPSTGEFLVSTTSDTTPVSTITIKASSGYGVKTITFKDSTGATITGASVTGIYFGTTVAAGTHNNCTVSESTASGSPLYGYGTTNSSSNYSYYTPSDSTTDSGVITFTSPRIADNSYIQIVGTSLSDVTTIVITDGFSNSCTFSIPSAGSFSASIISGLGSGILDGGFVQRIGGAARVLEHAEVGISLFGQNNASVSSISGVRLNSRQNTVSLPSDVQKRLDAERAAQMERDRLWTMAESRAREAINSISQLEKDAGKIRAQNGSSANSSAGVQNSADAQSNELGMQGSSSAVQESSSAEGTEASASRDTTVQVLKLLAGLVLLGSVIAVILLRKKRR